MKKINDIVKLGNIFNIVANLIQRHHIVSLFKLEIVAFLIYNNKDVIKSSKSERDIYKKVMSYLHMQLLANHEDFLYINESISILEKTEHILVSNDNIIIIKDINCIEDDYLESKINSELLSIVKKTSLKSFAEEVIVNV